MNRSVTDFNELKDYLREEALVLLQKGQPVLITLDRGFVMVAGGEEKLIRAENALRQVGLLPTKTLVTAGVVFFEREG